MRVAPDDLPRDPADLARRIQAHPAARIELPDPARAAVALLLVDAAESVGLEAAIVDRARALGGLCVFRLLVDRAALVLAPASEILVLRRGAHAPGARVAQFCVRNCAVS